MIVFVYEDICASAAGGDDESPPAASLLREGRAMLDAVTADFRRVLSVVVKHVTPPKDFAQQARDADYTLVIAPETGGRLEYLATEVVRVGGRLLGPSPEAIRLTGDKLALARHWQAKGVTKPKTGTFDEVEFNGPIVVKPRDGAGSQDMWIEAGGARSVSEGETPADFIAQDCIPGFAASVAFLIGPRA